MFKKIITFLIVAVMLCIGISVAAEESPIVLNGSVAVPGQEFEVTLTSNSSDIVSISGTLTFDTKLISFKEATPDLANWEVETNPQDGTVLFAAANVEKVNVAAKNTDIITFTFIAKENTLGQKATLAFKDVSLSNGDGKITSSGINQGVDILESIPSNGNESNGDSSEGNGLNGNGSNGNGSNGNGSNNGTTISGLSNNNRLASLTVKGVTLKPEFDPEEKQYEAIVPFEVEKLEVEAVAADEKATVTIKDTDLPYIGKNITRIQVVSESGLQRTYKIYTTRQAPAENSNAEKEESSTNWLMWIIIIVVALVLVVAVVIVLIIAKKKKMQK